MAKFCINCGKEIPEGANVCPNCGAAANGGVQPAAAQTVVVNNAQPKQSNGMAIAGFVISLVSLLCCGGLNWLSLIFSIIGLVKSKELNGAGKGLAIAGIIISCIGLVILIIFFAIGGLASIYDTASVSSYGY